MTTAQPAILAAVPTHCRYLSFQLAADADPDRLRQRLDSLRVDNRLVIGLGHSLLTTLGLQVPELRPYPPLRARIDLPATPAALWCWLGGEERGELLHRSRHLQNALAPDLLPDPVIEGFRHREGRDLTGYEDGTENPTGADAVDAALVTTGPLQHSSFVVVQRWRHDFGRFEALSPEQRDHSIGRRLNDNEELEDAPESAHVKRTAQESFDPEAFLLRRSMPWSDASGEGLMFVAFGHSLTAFESQLKRMCGLEDGIEDALFRFTRPESGAYFWCPPLRDNRLALDAATRK